MRSYKQIDSVLKTHGFSTTDVSLALCNYSEINNQQFFLSYTDYLKDVLASREELWFEDQFSRQQFIDTVKEQLTDTRVPRGRLFEFNGRYQEFYYQLNVDHITKLITINLVLNKTTSLGLTVLMKQVADCLVEINKIDDTTLKCKEFVTATVGVLTSTEPAGKNILVMGSRAKVTKLVYQSINGISNRYLGLHTHVLMTDVSEGWPGILEEMLSAKGYTDSNAETLSPEAARHLTRSMYRNVFFRFNNWANQAYNECYARDCNGTEYNFIELNTNLLQDHGAIKTLNASVNRARANVFIATTDIFPTYTIHNFNIDYVVMVIDENNPVVMTVKELNDKVSKSLRTNSPDPYDIDKWINDFFGNTGKTKSILASLKDQHSGKL